MIDVKGMKKSFEFLLKIKFLFAIVRILFTSTDQKIVKHSFLEKIFNSGSVWCSEEEYYKRGLPGGPHSNANLRHFYIQLLFVNDLV